MSVLFGKVDNKVNKKNKAKEYFVLELASMNWVVLDCNRQVRSSFIEASVDTFSILCQGRDVIVLVPGEDVHITQVELPKMAASKLKNAIPFALEDQVVDDVEQLHFAHFVNQQSPRLSPREALRSRWANQNRMVMMVTHEKMQSWLQRLQELQVTPTTMLPTTFALQTAIEREEEEQGAVMQIWVAPNEMLLCCVHDKFFVCDKENFKVYVTQIDNINAVNILNFTNTAFTLQSHLPAKETFISAQEYIVYLANGIKDVMQANLLQQTHAVKAPKFKSLHRFNKISFYLSFASLFLLLSYPLVSYYLLKSRTDQLAGQIAAIYKEQFPQSKSIIAPKIRMEEKLAQLKMKHGQDRFFFLLAALANAMHDAHHIKLQRLDYQNNQLVLRIIANSSADITIFTDLLSQRGLNVKQQNATLAGDRFNAAIQIE